MYKNKWPSCESFCASHIQDSVLQIPYFCRSKAHFLKRKKLKSPSPEEPEVTIADLVKLADAEGIDDEDLMEILTCPSPVWWEDHNYTEEICMRFHEDANDQENTVKENHHNTQPLTNLEELLDNNNLIKGVSINNRILTCDKTRKSLKSDVEFFKKFIEKRSKLEIVLGGIQTKKIKPNESQNRYQDKTDSKVRNDSTSGLSDASINEEELLKTLENIQIPVQERNSDSEEATSRDDTAINMNNYPNKSKEKKEKCISPKKKRNNKNGPQGARKSEKNTNKLDVKLKTISDKITEERNDYEIQPNEINNEIDGDLEIVPTELPPLTKNPFRNVPLKSTIESPKSIESVTSDSNSTVIEFDSISDTNIKFLDEYEEKTESNKSVTNELGKSNTKSTDELVTVYKIIPTNDNVDIEEHIKINLVNKSPPKPIDSLNTFYKKRKNIYGHKKKRGKHSNEIDTQIKDMKSYELAGADTKVKKENKINVKKYKYLQKYRSRGRGERVIQIPNTKVKYCHKCSSIFETDSCQYCTNKP